MAYTLVLIGGTGQAFGATVSGLAALGLLEAPDSVLVVDAEGRAGNETAFTKQVDRLLAIAKRQQAGVASATRMAPFDTAGGGGMGITLASRVLRDKEMGKLFELCFDEFEAGTAKHAALKKEFVIDEGFMARPNVAAAVMGAAFAKVAPGVAADGQQPFPVGLLKRVEGISTDIVVVGSLIGGTGAGLLAGITRQIAQQDVKRRVCLMGFMPWFKSATQQGASDAPGTMPGDLLLRANGDMGLRYIMRDLLGTTAPNVRVCLVGDPSADGAHLPVRSPAQEGGAESLPVSPFFLVGAAVLSGGLALFNEVTGQSTGAALYAFAARSLDDPLLDPADLTLASPDGQAKAELRHLISLTRANREMLTAISELQIPEAFSAFCLNPEALATKPVYASVLRATHTGASKRNIDSAWNDCVDDLQRRSAALEVFSEGVESWAGEHGNAKAMLGLPIAAELAQLAPAQVGKKSAITACLASQSFGSKSGDSLVADWSAAIATYLAATTRSAPRMQRDAGQLQWLLSRKLPTAPQQLGWQQVADGLDALSTGRLPDHVTRSSYPTPMAAAHFFADRVADGLEHAADAVGSGSPVGVCWDLWRGVATGLLAIDVIDLRSNAPGLSFFDRGIPFVEGDPSGRYIALLRPTFGTAAGSYVAASFPRCGFWPSVRHYASDAEGRWHDRGTFLQDLRTALNANHFQASITGATHLLRRFVRDAHNLAMVSHGDANLLGYTWLKLLVNRTSYRHNETPPDETRLHGLDRAPVGPVVLEWHGQTRVAAPEPFQIPVFDAGRDLRLGMALQMANSGGHVEVEAKCIRVYDVERPGQEVLRISLERGAGAGTATPRQAVTSGYLAVEIVGEVPVMPVLPADRWRAVLKDRLRVEESWLDHMVNLPTHVRPELAAKVAPRS